jgi:GNAT superfamily N-acetyltransferase
MRQLRLCLEADIPAMLDIINAAATAYRGVIRDELWHEPYMSRTALQTDIAAGVRFWSCEDGEMLGVMGLQAVRDVDLIRHAYVRPGIQRSGVGAALLTHLKRSSTRPLLVGTWADADWAIAFYRRHGFELLGPPRAAALLREYWSIPEQQIHASVVLELRRGD